MRAAIITRPGDPAVLSLRDVPIPEAGPGEIRVRVRAFGVNRADLLQRRGLYPPPPGAPPDIPGLEFAGEVDGIGEPVTPARAAPSTPGIGRGDRVMGITPGGSYAEYLVLPASQTLRVPDDMSFLEAAAVPEAFVTAYDALERAQASAEEWVLVHAVGSGVGTATLQLVQARGARCIGTSRTRAKLHRAMDLGLDVGIDTTVDELVADVRRVTGEGAHVAIDLVGGELVPLTLEALRPRGRCVLVGLTAGRRAELDLGLILRHRLRLEGTVLRTRSPAEKDELLSRFREAVVPLLATRTVRPVVDRVYPFDRVADSHAYLESNANFGKVVVEVS